MNSETLESTAVSDPDNGLSPLLKPVVDYLHSSSPRQQRPQLSEMEEPSLCCSSTSSLRACRPPGAPRPHGAGTYPMGSRSLWFNLPLITLLFATCFFPSDPSFSLAQKAEHSSQNSPPVGCWIQTREERR